MRKSVQGFIFDLDGTLIDSREDLVLSVNHALKTLGQAELPGDTIAGYVGDGVRNLLTSCLAHSDRQDLLDRAILLFQGHYGEHLLDHTRLYAGVMDILKWLQGKKMAVVTNKPEGFTLRILEGLGIRCYFDPVLGGDSTPFKKPNPEPILKVLQQWKIDAGETLVVGDSPNDIVAGKKSQTLTCGLTQGFRSRKEIQDSNPDWTIDSISEIRKILS